MLEIQKVEEKYGSVTKIPESDTESIEILHELTKREMDQPKIYKLTTKEYELMRKRMRKEISLKDLCRQINYSDSWIKPRIVAIKEGRYMIV